MITVIYLDVSPPARMPRDPFRRRMLGCEEQTTHWAPVATYGPLTIDMRWVFTSREGWLWEDRGRYA